MKKNGATKDLRIGAGLGSRLSICDFQTRVAADTGCLSDISDARGERGKEETTTTTTTTTIKKKTTTRTTTTATTTTTKTTATTVTTATTITTTTATATTTTTTTTTTTPQASGSQAASSSHPSCRRCEHWSVLSLCPQPVARPSGGACGEFCSPGKAGRTRGPSRGGTPGSLRSWRWRSSRT